MSDKFKVSVTIPKDDDGMIGRECLECERYFKLKQGTGIPTSHCHCPYCEYEGDADTFWTKAQLEYAKSVAINQAYSKLIKPSLDNLLKSFKDLERTSRGSLIQFKVKTKGTEINFPIEYYSEEELETKLTCDGCGLEFAVYGVFSRCPDCKDLNAFSVFNKSIAVTEKQLEIFAKPEIPSEIKEQSLSFVLTSCISTYDGLGKELRKRKPEKYPSKPKNLFQNIHLLNEKLNGLFEQKHSRFNEILKGFQVRHLYEHNLGVSDEDFAGKIPGYSQMIGRKYILRIPELKQFIVDMHELGTITKEHFEQE
jgi:hypothetical protein